MCIRDRLWLEPYCSTPEVHQTSSKAGSGINILYLLTGAIGLHESAYSDRWGLWRGLWFAPQIFFHFYRLKMAYFGKLGELFLEKKTFTAMFSEYLRFRIGYEPWDKIWGTLPQIVQSLKGHLPLQSITHLLPALLPTVFLQFFDTDGCMVHGIQHRTNPQLFGCWDSAICEPLDDAVRLLPP